MLNMKISQIFFTILTLLLFSQFSFPNAFAYIDPGSGSIIIQMIIGALVGVGIAVKVFWFKIKLRLSSVFNKNDSNDEI